MKSRKKGIRKWTQKRIRKHISKCITKRGRKEKMIRDRCRNRMRKTIG